MVVIQWRFQWREICGRLRTYCTWKISQAILTYRILTYNIHMSQSYFIDCLLEPLIWFVDNFSGCVGKVFIFSVSSITTAVAAIAYWIGVPYWWERNRYITVGLIIIGNWILLNILFHYYKGVTTPPGYPPRGKLIVEAASVCKKCISPRPPRTHHCSVCDKCILAMDHHCPWFNNCVGYFNARYFFLYMVYLVIGCGFLIIAGFDLGYQVLWVGDTGGILHENDPDLIGHPVRMNQSGVLVPVLDIVEYDSENVPREHDLPIPVITEAQRISASTMKISAVWFMAIISVAVFVSLGILSVMHATNITRGETSIEYHSNSVLRKSKRHEYSNPYDLGWLKNWKIFLGLTQGRTFVRHILLPSSHPPVGNGLIWHTIHDSNKDWP